MKLEPPAHAVHNDKKKLYPKMLQMDANAKGRNGVSALLPYLRDPLMSSLFLRETW